MIEKREERVLCAAVSDLPRDWLPREGVMPMAEEELWLTLRGIRPHWLARSQAEQDEHFKQWIPYVILRDADGQIATYPRKGAESRLHGVWSLGVGGHVNTSDSSDPELARESGRGDFWKTAIWNGLRRELAEEFHSVRWGQTRFLGLIHEDLTAVGRVHLGAVFLHELAGNAEEPGPELAGLRWISPSAMGQGIWSWDRFELWSRLAFRLLPTGSSMNPCLPAGNVEP